MGCAKFAMFLNTTQTSNGYPEYQLTKQVKLASMASGFIKKLDSPNSVAKAKQNQMGEQAHKHLQQRQIEPKSSKDMQK